MLQMNIPFKIKLFHFDEISHPKPAFLLVQKLKSARRAFTLGVKAYIENKNSICPELVINAEHYGLLLAPRQKFATPKLLFPKLLNIDPKYFWP